MSKIKRSLPEDIDVTGTEPDYVPVLDDDLPDRTDFAVAQLQDAIYDLQELKDYLNGYWGELAYEVKKLDELVKSIKMPF